MNHLIRNSILALGALALTACSGTSATSWLKDVNFASSNNGDVQITLTAQMSTSEVSITPVDMQFYHPNNPSELIAAVDVTNPSTTETDIAVTYDFTQLLSFSNITSTTTLPNGTPVPVAGPNPTWLVVSPSGSSASKIYLNINAATKHAVVGYVLSADKLSSGVVGNILLNFTLTGLSGTGAAGIYSGTAAGSSGFAFFADVSAVFGAAVNNALKITDLTPDAAKVQIEKHMYDLNQDHAKLILH